MATVFKLSWRKRAVWRRASPWAKANASAPSTSLPWLSRISPVVMKREAREIWLSSTSLLNAMAPRISPVKPPATARAAWNAAKIPNNRRKVNATRLAALAVFLVD